METFTDEAEFAVNHDLDSIITPVNAVKLVELLRESQYDENETNFLEQGFTTGFDIGYSGPRIRQSCAHNIPLRLGSETELWNKLIKEVKLNRVAGPYDDIPFDNYIQSPIGLVPKAGNSGKTRLIFHLSYDFGDSSDQQSLNHHTPRNLCSVKYNDLDHAVANCLEVRKQLDELKANCIRFEEQIADDVIFLGKTDVQSAFHLVPLSVLCFCWLIMQARNLKTKRMQYFVDKCLPFGACISCAIFQRFSNALRRITEFKTGHKSITNYLDDFLFAAYAKAICNNMIQTFLDICSDIGVPIASEKTVWADSIIEFLGILLDGIRMILGIPEEKRQ